MKKRWKHISANNPNRAFTLIEVLASVALLGALLSMMLISVARHTEQARMAQDRLEAFQIADSLLTDWLVQNGGVIPSEQGSIQGHPDWEWQIEGKVSHGLANLGAHTAVLMIVDRIAKEKKERTLAEIEFVSTSPLTAAAAGLISLE